MKKEGFSGILLSAVILFAVSAAAVCGLFALKEYAEPKRSVVPPSPVVPDEDDDPIFIREDREPTVTADDAKAAAARTPDGTVRGVTDTAALSSERVDLPFAGNLAEEGYGTTDLPFDGGTMKMAVMTPNFEITDEFSLRTKTVRDKKIVQTVIYGEFSVEETERETNRPALDVYMGYLVADDGEKLTIISPSGQRLTSFDDSVYVPAYERDRTGAPLFRTTGTGQSGRFDGETVGIKIYKEDDPDREDARVHLAREPREKDKTVFLEGEIEHEGEGSPVSEQINVYYRLSWDGSYFAYSDYNEFTESRGAHFDYPAYYALPQDGRTLSVKLYDLYRQWYDKPLEMFHKGAWQYTVWGSPVGEESYERAYNFSEGLGCVLTEPYYKDGGLFFVNTAGQPVFGVQKQHRDNTGRLIVESFMPPLDPEDAIGCYYFDHGLCRVRLESVDGNNYVFDCKVRYLGTRDVLIDRRGEIFPIPDGYEIRAYSDGIITLERDGRFGYMDYTGEWIAEPVYRDARPFSEGLGVLTAGDGKVGVIDRDGRIVVPFRYSFISAVSSGIAAAYEEGAGWRIIRKMAPS